MEPSTLLNLSVPTHIAPLRAKVLAFIEQRIYPQERELLEGEPTERRKRLKSLMAGILIMGSCGFFLRISAIKNSLMPITPSQKLAQ